LSNIACYVIALSNSTATVLIFFIKKDYVLFINMLKSAHLVGFYISRFPDTIPDHPKPLLNSVGNHLSDNK